MDSTRREFIKYSSQAALALASMGSAGWKNIALAMEGEAAPRHPLIAGIGVQEKIYYEENFRNYGDTAPCCVDDAGISLGNDPIWNNLAQADIRLKRSSFVFKNFLPPQAEQGTLTSSDVLFQFRLLPYANGDPGHFELHLRHQSEKQADLVIAIFSEKTTISSKGITPAINTSDTLPFELGKNEWHTGVVTVRNGTVDVYIDDDRVMKKVAHTTMPALSYAGINFYGFEGSGFSVTDIIVRAPGPLPNHAITNILPLPVEVDKSTFQKGGTYTVAANDIFGATLIIGDSSDPLPMTIHWEDGNTNEISFRVMDMPDQRWTTKDGKLIKEKYTYPDTIIETSGIGDQKKTLDYHIRPLLRRYHTSSSITDTYRDIVRDWDMLPTASQHPLQVECRRTGKGIDVYLDSCYAGSLAGSAVKEITFALPPQSMVGKPISLKANFDRQKYFPLVVAALGMSRSFVDASLPLSPGLQKVKDIPLFVASGEQSADIGLTREGQGSWALSIDEYLARSPFDGFLTEVHFTVPGKAPYTTAWVLCAVDPDPAKDPILTTRITHYLENGIGGNLIADTTIRLPRAGEKLPANMRQVGTVTIKETNVKTPLYLLEVPFDSGKIIDIEMNQTSLNVEFFGKPDQNLEQIDRTMKPDPKSVSAVQLFGVTLEKSPVGMELVQTQPGNIFANDDKPETSVILKSFTAAKGKVIWKILDVNGKTLEQRSAAYRFSQAGQEQTVTLPLAMKEPGWYELLISLEDTGGKTLLTHPASFALLGRDERKAKYNSPYGSWWFDGVHGSPGDLQFAGPIMFKAGIRKAAYTRQTEKSMAPWGITKQQAELPLAFSYLQSPQTAIQKWEDSLNKTLEAYPHIQEVLIFHESGPGNDIPLELLGIKPELTPDRLAREKQFAELFNMAGAFIREKFPQLKTVVGNLSGSQAVIAAILRHGGNPDYIDYIGIEAPSQVFIPEKLQEWALQATQIARDTAKVLSGRDIPATGCYEFTYRCERDMGKQQQAEWYMRDVLISLANQFTRIGPGILFDASNAYYNDNYGASGILYRAPYGYPKKAYVAYATLTNALDQVRFRRQIDTGSNTCFAVEFDREDKKYASAIWAARGEADWNITFAGDTTVKLIEMYGASREIKTAAAQITVRAGVSPVYLIADQEVKEIRLGSRSFPKDQIRARQAIVAAPLNQRNQVTLDKDESLNTPLVFPLQTPIRQVGDFTLRQAMDAQKGGCVELELNPNNSHNKYIMECITLRLNIPAIVTGTPAALGIWVKGNSNWGRVMFELEDAHGEIWRSMGTGGWGCDILDWPGNIAVNFDGWNFVALPLRNTALFNANSPGPVLEQWISNGGNKKIDFPIKIRGLIIEMNRQPLNLIDFSNVDSSIRLKDICGIYERNSE